MNDKIESLGEDFLRIKSELESTQAELEKLRSNTPLVFGKEKHATRVKDTEGKLTEVEQTFLSIKTKLNDCLHEHYQRTRAVLSKMLSEQDDFEEFKKMNDDVRDALNITKKYDYDEKRSISELLVWKWIQIEFCGIKPDSKQYFLETQEQTSKLKDFESNDPIINIALGYHNLQQGDLVVKKFGQPMRLANDWLDKAASYFKKVIRLEEPKDGLNYVVLAQGYSKILKEIYYF